MPRRRTKAYPSRPTRNISSSKKQPLSFAPQSLESSIGSGVSRSRRAASSNHGRVKARMRMNVDELTTRVHGRCLWVRATAEHLPTSTVTIWAVDYFYSNARIEHDM